MSDNTNSVFFTESHELKELRNINSNIKDIDASIQKLDTDTTTSDIIVRIEKLEKTSKLMCELLIKLNDECKTYETMQTKITLEQVKIFQNINKVILKKPRFRLW